MLDGTVVPGPDADGTGMEAGWRVRLVVGRGSRRPRLCPKEWEGPPPLPSPARPWEWTF